MFPLPPTPQKLTLLKRETQSNGPPEGSTYFLGIKQTIKSQEEKSVFYGPAVTVQTSELDMKGWPWSRVGSPSGEKGASPLEKEQREPRRGGVKSARGWLGRTKKQLWGEGGQGAGHVWRKSAAGGHASRGRKPPLIPKSRSLSLTVPSGAPSTGCQLPGSLLLPPLFPYLVFQPLPHSPASSSPPVVTR